jgi:hypothetical protein
MRWIDFLFGFGARRKLAQLVAQVARLSEPEVAAALDGRMMHMSAAQARGYIRARARLTVENRAAFVFSSGKMRPPPALFAAATGQALDRVVGRLVAAHVISQPIFVSTSRRRAA